jgi:hypothetical protein
VKKGLVDVLGMTKFSRRWIPETLIITQKVYCADGSRVLVQAFKADAKKRFVNLWFVSWSKSAMRCQLFDGAESVREFSMDLWRNLDPSTLMSVYRDWIERL